MRTTWNATKICLSSFHVSFRRSSNARIGLESRSMASRSHSTVGQAGTNGSFLSVTGRSGQQEGRNGLQVDQIPSLRDNYIYVITDKKTGTRGIVDPAEAAPVLEHLGNGGLQVDFIFNTHHHHDHVGGNLELKQKLSCTVVGASSDKHRIPGIDVQVSEGSRLTFGSQEVIVIETPGHTTGHICYWFPYSSSLFVGDTLFALGCGRLFEGSAEQMWNSLGKLAQLPKETMVYCAHEYTQSNSRFAMHVDPQNEALIARKREIDERRQRGLPTVPFKLGDDLETNPFLRASEDGLSQAMGLHPGASEVEVFAALRRAKDVFAG